MLFSRFLSLLPIIVNFATVSNFVSVAYRIAITTLKAGYYGSINGSSCACTVLIRHFKEKVLLPNSTAYTAEATHFYDLRKDLTPKCIFVPSTPNDVATGVVILDICQSQFAYSRRRTYTGVAGAANIDGGVLVALGAFTTITLSADRKSIEAGVALNWYDLYSFLEPYGKIVIGGRLKTIGIAGLTTGGGISYFTAKYGFAMDNVLAYEIITASGAVLTASATNNPDLFWAMKGGGSNFAIVTKFTFATYDMPTVSTAIIVYTEEVFPAYITALADLANYQDQVDTRAGVNFGLGSTPSTGALSTTSLGVQAGNTTGPAVFKNFMDIPSAYSPYNVTTRAYWSSTLDTTFQETRNMYGMHAIIADNMTLQSMYTAYVAETAAMANVTGFAANLVFQPIPKSATTVAKTNGIGSTWGVDNSKSYFYWLITSQWTDAADDKIVTEWSDTLRENIHATNIESGFGVDLMYMNDCSNSQKPFSGMPADNLAKLKTIRQKYNPELVFRKLSTGGYKLDQTGDCREVVKLVHKCNQCI